MVVTAAPVAVSVCRRAWLFIASWKDDDERLAKGRMPGGLSARG